MSKDRARLNRSALTSGAGRIVQIRPDDLAFVSGGGCFIDQNGQIVCDAGHPRQQ